jgi:hypothetical protein
MRRALEFEHFLGLILSCQCPRNSRVRRSAITRYHLVWQNYVYGEVMLNICKYVISDISKCCTVIIPITGKRKLSA